MFLTVEANTILAFQERLSEWSTYPLMVIFLRLAAFRMLFASSLEHLTSTAVLGPGGRLGAKDNGSEIDFSMFTALSTMFST
jgi:hypothetical protein